MIDVHEKDISKNPIMDMLQVFFCLFRKHAHHLHRKVKEYAYARHHHFLIYVHILLLLLCFYFYHIVSFNMAEDFTIDQPVVQQQAEAPPSADETTPPTEQVSGELSPAEAGSGGSAVESGNLPTGQAGVEGGNVESREISTGEITTGEVLSGEISTGDIGSGENGGIISGEIITGEILSGAILSGDTSTATGEINSGTQQQWNSGENLVFRLDATDPDTFVLSGNSVLQWLDKRYNGKKAYMHDDARCPDYDTRIINGHPAVYFDDVDDGMQTNISLSDPYTIFVVYNVQQKDLSSTRVLQGMNNRYIGTWNDSIVSYAGGIIGQQSLYLAPDFVITTLSNDGTQSQFYVNNQDVTTNDSKIAAPIDFGLGTAGYTQDAPMGGYISEVLVFNNALPDSDRTEIYTYLQNKYGDLVSHSSRGTSEASPIESGEIASGEINTGIIDTGIIETGIVDTGIVDTGIVDTGIVDTGIIDTGTISTGEIIPQVANAQTAISSAQGGSDQDDDQDDVSSSLQDTIITGYFNQAYALGDQNAQILELQKLLTYLQLYSGALDSTYSDEVISAVYHFQEQNGLLAGQENNISIQGYLGPKTRNAINQAYAQYQISLQTQEQTNGTAVESGTVESGTVSTGGIDTSSGAIISGGTDALANIGTITGVNIIVLFDPLMNPLLFSGMMNASGFQWVLSGSQRVLSGSAYTTGAQIGLLFNTGTKEQIMQYLIDQGYDTGTMTLVPVGNKFMVGDQVLDFADLSGILLVPIVLQSTNELSGNIAEVQIPEGAVLTTADGNQFTGELAPPVFQDPVNIENKINKDVLSAIEVGNQDQHIQLEDGSGNDLNATVRMPVPGKQVGDQIDIYSSEDGIDFTYLTTAIVQDIQGDPYVVFSTDHFSVIITVATNGTNLSADKAGNSTSGSAYTALGNIVIAEGSNTDMSARQTNKTLILTAPTNWRFRTGSGSVSYTSSRDITAASIAVAASTITVTFSTDSNANQSDTITISAIRAQAITGNINIGVTGYIYRTAANPGTATIAGITNNSTNFGSLLQIPGAAKNMITTLPGQTFAPITGNTGTPANQQVGIGFVINTITAIDQFRNIATSYGGSKTLSYTGPGGTPSYTTGVSFTNGQSTTVLATTLTQAFTGVTITATDGTLTGIASSAFNVVPVDTNLNSGNVTQAPYNCATGAYSCDLSSKGITSIAANTFINHTVLQALYLQSNQITSLASGSFNGLSTLNTLNLESNQIASINTGAFNGLPNLAYLYLGYSQLTTLASNTFTGLSKLTTLDLSFGQLTTIKSGAFNGLSGLTTLTIMTNHLTTLETGAFNGLSSIQTLYLINNQLATLPEALTGLTTLLNGQLSVDSNKICIGSMSSALLTFVNAKEGGTAWQATQDTSSCDTTAPTLAEVTPVPTPTKNTTPSYTFSSNEAGTISYSGDCSSATTSAISGNNTITFNALAPGTHSNCKVRVTDAASNPSSRLTVTTFAIDTTPPTATISYVPATLTSGNVVATLTGYSETLTGINATGYTFTGNGSFVFTFSDLAGNTGSTTATVTRIDKTAPTATISYNPATLTSGNVIATLTGYSETLTGLNATGHTFTGNGSFVFTFQDLAGNTGSTTATVTRIDKTPPTATVSYNPATLTSGNAIATLTGFSETGVTITNNGGSANYTFTGNGSFTYTFQDAAGNTGSTTATVTRIDKTPPTATVTYVPGSGSATTGNVVVTLTGYSETLTGINATGYSFTGNGSFVFTFSDLAGNTGSTTARVYRINPVLGTITGATRNTNYSSNTITIGGYGTGTTSVSMTSGTLYKNGLALSGTSATGTDGDQFYIRLLSSGSGLTSATSTMTIGITSGVFTITTKDVPSISAPASFDFSGRAATDQIQTITKTFSGSTDYFKLIDNMGENTGYYTTISMSNMTTASGDILPYTAIAAKSLTSIVTLSGTANPRVYSAITGTYQYFTASPLTFIKRDTAANGGVTGTYGLQTVWKIDIPALQNVGTYTGVITYTLY